MCQLTKDLCILHTSLNFQEIQTICDVAKTLQLTADLTKANVFIDCMTKEGQHAIVVAEAAPTTTKPIYKKSVVGKYAYKSFEPAVFLTMRTGKHIAFNRAITQEGRTVEQSVVPIKGNNDRILGTLIMEKDISDEIKNKDRLEALSKATETLSGVLSGIEEHSPPIPEVMEEAIFYVEPKGSILYFNPAAMNLATEIGNISCEVGTPIQKYFHFVDDILNDPEDLLIKEINISAKTFKIKKVNLSHHHHLQGIFIIFRDITELREKERELIAKSVAIREIHHRVKNNLQTVASLLRLQLRRKIPEESKGYFLESLNQILSIASVYELILSSSNIDEVDIMNLTKKIGNMLVYSERKEHSDIRIIYKGSALTIQSNKAVSVALIINELIQNCMNHAFHGMENGLIEVAFRRDGSQIIVQVNDNGIGFSKSAQPSLGLDITKLMSEHDLAGHFTIEQTKDGTSATVKFPLEEEV